MSLIRDYWRWRQDTPRMQLATISQSIEGSLFVISETNDGQRMMRMASDIVRDASQILALIPFLVAGKW